MTPGTSGEYLAQPVSLFPGTRSFMTDGSGGVRHSTDLMETRSVANQLVVGVCDDRYAERIEFCISFGVDSPAIFL